MLPCSMCSPYFWLTLASNLRTFALNIDCHYAVNSHLHLPSCALPTLAMNCSASAAQRRACRCLAMHLHGTRKVSTGTSVAMRLAVHASAPALALACRARPTRCECALDALQLHRVQLINLAPQQSKVMSRICMHRLHHGRLMLCV